MAKQVYKVRRFAQDILGESEEAYHLERDLWIGDDLSEAREVLKDYGKFPRTEGHLALSISWFKLDEAGKWQYCNPPI